MCTKIANRGLEALLLSALPMCVQRAQSTGREAGAFVPRTMDRLVVEIRASQALFSSLSSLPESAMMAVSRKEAQRIREVLGIGVWTTLGLAHERRRR